MNTLQSTKYTVFFLGGGTLGTFFFPLHHTVHESRGSVGGPARKEATSKVTAVVEKVRITLILWGYILISPASHCMRGSTLC